MAGNARAPGESVAQRLLGLLEAFDTASPRLTLSQIARRSGLAVSTARRLIIELTHRGWLERLPGGEYQIGLPVWVIGSLANRTRALRDAATPVMHDLFEVTRETVQLTVLDGETALCIEKITSPESTRNDTLIGGRLPLHASSVGKCLLAGMSAAQLKNLCSSGLERFTGRTITEPGRLASTLAKVRREGKAVTLEELTVGVVSVASPIRDVNGATIAALGVVTHFSVPIDRLTPAVQTSALAIERAFARTPIAPHVRSAS